MATFLYYVDTDVSKQTIFEMNQKNKILEKFVRNPSSLKYKAIENILLHLGFIKIEAKGSHKKFKHFLIPNDLIIPVHGNDCKEFYKKYIAKIIKENFQ